MAADRIEPEFAKRQDAIGASWVGETRSYRILTNRSPLTHDFGAHCLRITDRRHFWDSEGLIYAIHTKSALFPFLVCSGRARPTGGGRRGCSDDCPHRSITTSTPKDDTGAGAGHAIAPRLQNSAYIRFPSAQGGARAVVHEPGLESDLRLQSCRGRARFAEAARLDPSLAIAYWGQALVLGPNINAPMDAEAEPKALALIQKAIALKPKGHRARACLHRCARGRYTGKPGDRAAATARMRGDAEADGAVPR